MIRIALSVFYMTINHIWMPQEMQFLKLKQAAEQVLFKELVEDKQETRLYMAELRLILSQAEKLTPQLKENERFVGLYKDCKGALDKAARHLAGLVAKTPEPGIILTESTENDCSRERNPACPLSEFLLNRLSSLNSKLDNQGFELLLRDFTNQMGEFRSFSLPTETEIDKFRAALSTFPEKLTDVKSTVVGLKYERGVQESLDAFKEGVEEGERQLSEVEKSIREFQERLIVVESSEEHVDKLIERVEPLAEHLHKKQRSLLDILSELCSN